MKKKKACLKNYMQEITFG